MHMHVFHLNTGGPGTEELEDDDLAAASQWLLPSLDFDGLWDSLVFDDAIKARVSPHEYSVGKA